MADQPQTNFLCPVTIGRAAEIEDLRAFLRSDGGVLLVSGEAGVGKSRLVREARLIAEASEIRVLEGRCFEADRALPFAPALDVLHALIDRLGVSETAQLAGPAAADLARLVPELATRQSFAAHDAVDGETAKRRLLDGFARLMAGFANEQPLLLVIEDIHWPDASSLELLLHLARRSARDRLHLLLTYRSDEVHPELEHFLATLDRERLSAEIRLAPLGSAQVATMLQVIFAAPDPAPAALLHAMYSLTEGNPFFLEEVLTALGAQGRSVAADGSWVRDDVLNHLRIPRSVHDAVRQRLSKLSDPARHMLTVAAVAGRRFDFDLLRELSGHEEDELLALVKELVTAHLVVEESGDRFVFRHALTREAIYAGLLDRERRLLHRRIAETIMRLQEASPEKRLDDLATHFFAAGAWAPALDAAHRAGVHAASLQAPRAAAEHFSRAIDAARALGIRPDPEIHRERGRAYETLGAFDRALADYQIAFDLARSDGDLRGEWQTLLDLSLLWLSRDFGEAGAYAERALETANTLGDPVAIARSLNRLGNWRLNMEEPREAIRLHREALTIFEHLADHRGMAETLDLLGVANVMGTDTAEAAAAYYRAVDIWRTLADRRGLAGSLTGCTFCGFNFHTDTVPAADLSVPVDATGAESLLLSREISWRAGESWSLWILHGMVHGAMGSYGTALPGARQALEIAEEIAHQEWITASRCMLGNIYGDLGQFDAACAELQAALAVARQIDSRYWTHSATGWLASALVRAGDLSAAAAVLNDELRGEPPLDSLGGRLLWCAAAELALKSGEPEKALEIVQRLEEATPGNERRPIPRLGKICGEALVAIGRTEEAGEVLRIARAEAAAIGARPMLWRIEASLGRLYRATGHPEDANRAFASAQTIVQELATSVPDDELRETFLTWAAGMLPSGFPLSGRDAATERNTLLSKRELQVAALLTEGLTNRKIGERLFLSEWTVATHVRNILAKLDLSSRAQIAAWVASHGVGPDA